MRNPMVYIRWLGIKGHVRTSDKYWNIESGRWLQYFKFFWIYFYKSSIWTEQNKYFINTKRIKPYKVKEWPVVYHIDEIKIMYPNYYMIPTSPMIMIKSDKKLHTIQEARSLYKKH